MERTFFILTTIVIIALSLGYLVGYFAGKHDAPFRAMGCEQKTLTATAPFPPFILLAKKEYNDLLDEVSK